jgi:ribosomal protein S18 acetylase RimI-like enzyme
MTDATEIRLRDAGPGDRAAVSALTLAAYGEYAERMEPRAWAGLDEAVRRALAGDDPAVERIVAERGGEIVGSVMLFPAQVSAYEDFADALAWPELRLLAVAPAARGTGVGRMLVEECMRRAKAAGATEMGLHTSRSMEAAIAMYEGMGFVRVPEHDFQPEGAELVTAYRVGLG